MLSADEVNLIFEHLTQHNQVSGIQVIFAEGAKPEELDYMRMAADVPMGSNARASEAYRRKVAPVLMERAVQACLKR